MLFNQAGEKFSVFPVDRIHFKDWVGRLHIREIFLFFLSSEVCFSSRNNELIVGVNLDRESRYFSIKEADVLSADYNMQSLPCVFQNSPAFT